MKEFRGVKSPFDGGGYVGGRSGERVHTGARVRFARATRAARLLGYKTQNVLHAIDRSGDPDVQAPPAVVPSKSAASSFAVGDDVMVRGVRTVVLATRPGGVQVRGAGWVAESEVEER